MYYLGIIDILKKPEKKKKDTVKKKEEDGEAAAYAARLEAYMIAALAAPPTPVTALEALSQTLKP